MQNYVFAINLTNAANHGFAINLAKAEPWLCHNLANAELCSLLTWRMQPIMALPLTWPIQNHGFAINLANAAHHGFAITWPMQNYVFAINLASAANHGFAINLANAES